MRERERERKKQNYKLWPLYIIYLCMYIEATMVRRVHFYLIFDQQHGV